MLRLASLVLLAAPLVGCAAHTANLRTELVTSGTAGGSFTLPAGIYDLDLRVGTPQAQLVHWTLTCPGDEKQGVLGETFDNYRTRRLSQLQADRERQQRAVANTTNFIVGAVAPRVVATNGPVTVQASTSGEAAGAAAASTIQPIMELPPGDTGGGTLLGHVRFASNGESNCSLAVAGESARVGLAYDVTRTYDVKFEAGQKARGVRGALVAHLEVEGADPEARTKRLAAEAEAARVAEEERARAAEAQRIEDERLAAEANAKRQAELVVIRQQEAKDRAARETVEAHERAVAAAEDARVRAEVSARLERERKLRIELEMHIRVTAMAARTALIGYLSWCGADAGHYAEVQAKLRIEIEMKMRIEMEERERREAQLRIIESQDNARLQQLERERQMRIQLALNARNALIARLVAFGARERPPMPAMIVETRGVAPFDGAVWIAGDWSFSAATWAWSWTPGGWSDSGSFGSSGNSGTQNRAPAAVAVEVQVPVETHVVVEAPAPQPVQPVQPALVVETRTPAVTVSVPAPVVTVTTHSHSSGVTVTRPPHPTRAQPQKDKPVVRDHRK